jgi:hypothetical protein
VTKECNQFPSPHGLLQDRDPWPFEGRLALRDILANQAFNVLIKLIDPRNFIYDGDLRPTGIAGEFKLGLRSYLGPCEAVPLAALRARDIDAVSRHFEVPLAPSWLAPS